MKKWTSDILTLQKFDMRLRDLEIKYRTIPQEKARMKEELEAASAVTRNAKEQQQKVERAAHDDKRRQHERHDFVQQRRAVDARRGGREVWLPRRAGQAVLAQRAVSGIPTDLDMTVRTGIHFSTSVA